MYQNSAFASEAMGRIDGGSAAGSDPRPSVQQLRSVMAELLIALRSALGEERGRAVESLRRAAAILQIANEARAPAGTPVRGGLAPWQVRKVVSHIETNLDSAIRSEDLATMVRLNPCHFSRAFRNSVGMSPLEYVIRRRMERAQDLMLSTNSPLSQIALDCGLADQAHFSRMFRRIVGESPRIWRRARISPDG